MFLKETLTLLLRYCFARKVSANDVLRKLLFSVEKTAPHTWKYITTPHWLKEAKTLLKTLSHCAPTVIAANIMALPKPRITITNDRGRLLYDKVAQHTGFIIYGNDA